MRFDLHLRAEVRQRTDALAARMRAWELKAITDSADSRNVVDAIRAFGHTTTFLNLRVAGVDGAGDYPAISYSDSFVYVTIAQAVCYEASTFSGLKEAQPALPAVVEFTWLPEEQSWREEAFDKAFEALAGASLDVVLSNSDYWRLKASTSGQGNTVASLSEGLIRPHASDAANLSVQLRSTGELGAALRALQGVPSLDYLLIDTTFSLPFVSNAQDSLFHEHLKRLCCVEARAREIGFFALSKSHGLPGMESIEEGAREKLGLARGMTAEHWYLRLPIPGIDEWELPNTRGRRVPPVGAVTYLVRFHRTTPVLRLDMDRDYWLQYVRGETEVETATNEQRIFEQLDYASHDQRSYGYPYPLKAAHDRTSLTQPERIALRKQIIDAAVRSGMKRSLFTDAAQATGHR